MTFEEAMNTYFPKEEAERVLALPAGHSARMRYYAEMVLRGRQCDPPPEPEETP